MSVSSAPAPAYSRARMGTQILRWLPRIGVTAWAGFWAWFVAAAGTSDIRAGLSGTVPVMAAWLGALSVLAACVWIWPRVGGAMMFASGIGAGLYFHNTGAQLLLALPAVLIGLVAMISPQAGRIPR